MALNIGGRVHRPTSPLSLGGRRITGIEHDSTGGITPGDQNRINRLETIVLEFQTGTGTTEQVNGNFQSVRMGTGDISIWKGWVPRLYDNRNLALEIAWSSQGTDGSAFVEFNVAFQTVNPGRVATDGTFAAAQSMLQTDTTTIDQIDYIFRLWSHAEMNSIGDTEQFLIRLERIAPSGRTDVAGDVDIYGMMLYAT